jgi:hypothetical protein
MITPPKPNFTPILLSESIFGSEEIRFRSQEDYDEYIRRYYPSKPIQYWDPNIKLTLWQKFKALL